VSPTGNCWQNPRCWPGSNHPEAKQTAAINIDLAWILDIQLSSRQFNQHLTRLGADSPLESSLRTGPVLTILPKLTEFRNRQLINGISVIHCPNRPSYYLPNTSVERRDAGSADDVKLDLRPLLL